MIYYKFNKLSFELKQEIYDAWHNDFYSRKEICETYLISEHTLTKIINYMEGKQV